MESAQKESVGEGVLLCQAHVQTLGKESESLPAKPEALHLQIPMLCEPPFSHCDSMPDINNLSGKRA